MKIFGRSTKIAGALTAALMISAPLALSATPTFAADYHSGDRHDGDTGRGDNYRGDNGRGDNYRGDNYRGDRGDHYRGDRDGRGMRHETIMFRFHHERFGHWGYAHGHRFWMMTYHAR